MACCRIARGRNCPRKGFPGHRQGEDQNCPLGASPGPQRGAGAAREGTRCGSHVDRCPWEPHRDDASVTPWPGRAAPEARKSAALDRFPWACAAGPTWYHATTKHCPSLRHFGRAAELVCASSSPGTRNPEHSAFSASQSYPIALRLQPRLRPRRDDRAVRPGARDRARRATRPRRMWRRCPASRPASGTPRSACRIEAGPTA